MGRRRVPWYDDPSRLTLDPHADIKRRGKIDVERRKAYRAGRQRIGWCEQNWPQYLKGDEWVYECWRAGFRETNPVIARADRIYWTARNWWDTAAYWVRRLSSQLRMSGRNHSLQKRPEL
jgi:hypothetical protein